jgi:hypothetical protein
VIALFVVSSVCIAVAVIVWLTRMALGGWEYGEAVARAHPPPVGWQPSIVLPIIALVAGIRGVGPSWPPTTIGFVSPATPSAPCG